MSNYQLDTRNWKLHPADMEHTVEVKETEILAEHHIGPEEMDGFITGLKNRYSFDNQLWFTKSNLKYIWFIETGGTMMVTDRYGNPVDWKNI